MYVHSLQEDRENILRARASGKGVLTRPFKLLESNHLGVVLTLPVYNTDLPVDATPEQRTKAAAGFVPSLLSNVYRTFTNIIIVVFLPRRSHVNQPWSVGKPAIFIYGKYLIFDLEICL